MQIQPLDIFIYTSIIPAITVYLTAILKTALEVKSFKWKLHDLTKINRVIDYIVVLAIMLIPPFNIVVLGILLIIIIQYSPVLKIAYICCYPVINEARKKEIKTLVLSEIEMFEQKYWGTGSKIESVKDTVIKKVLIKINDRYHDNMTGAYDHIYTKIIKKHLLNNLLKNKKGKS